MKKWVYQIQFRRPSDWLPFPVWDYPVEPVSRMRTWISGFERRKGRLELQFQDFDHRGVVVGVVVVVGGAVAGS